MSGRVQGVGFRWFVHGVARQLGLRGTARNLPDGRVEVVAHGGPADLEKMEARLRQGPAGAHVQGVSSDENTDTPPADFRITG